MKSSVPGTVLLICTGNTCRSPMAARLLEHALVPEKNPLNRLEVLSAGVAAGNGYPPSENSVAALKKVGIDLSDHLSTQLTDDLLDRAHCIFGMTRSHLDSVRYLVGDRADDRLFLMRQFMEYETNLEIPDPFGGDFSHYENARDAMVEAIPSLLQFLRSRFLPPV